MEFNKWKNKGSEGRKTKDIFPLQSCFFGLLLAYDPEKNTKNYVLLIADLPKPVNLGA